MQVIKTESEDGTINYVAFVLDGQNNSTEFKAAIWTYLQQYYPGVTLAEVFERMTEYNGHKLTLAWPAQ